MTSNNENRIKQLEEELAQALYVNRAIVKTAMAKEADDAATIAALKAQVAVLEARKPSIVWKIVTKVVKIESAASLEAIACLNAALGHAASALVDKDVEIKDARIAAAALARGITNLTVKYNQASSSLASADAKIANLKGRHAAEMKAAAASQARLVNELEAAKAALDSRPALALDKVDKVDSATEIDDTPRTPTTVSVPVVSGPILPASKELDALRTAFLTATSKADKAICHDALASALIDGFCSTTTTTTTTTTASTTTTTSDNEATLKQELAEANRALGIAKGLILTLKSRLPASV